MNVFKKRLVKNFSSAKFYDSFVRSNIEINSLRKMSSLFPPLPQLYYSTTATTNTTILMFRYHHNSFLHYHLAITTATTAASVLWSISPQPPQSVQFCCLSTNTNTYSTVLPQPAPLPFSCFRITIKIIITTTTTSAILLFHHRRHHQWYSPVSSSPRPLDKKSTEGAFYIYSVRLTLK